MPSFIAPGLTRSLTRRSANSPRLVRATTRPSAPRCRPTTPRDPCRARDARYSPTPPLSGISFRRTGRLAANPSGQGFSPTGDQPQGALPGRWGLNRVGPPLTVFRRGGGRDCRLRAGRGFTWLFRLGGCTSRPAPSPASVGAQTRPVASPILLMSPRWLCAWMVMRGPGCQVPTGSGGRANRAPTGQTAIQGGLDAARPGRRCSPWCADLARCALGQTTLLNLRHFDSDV
jgi:hypothetical protein